LNAICNDRDKHQIYGNTVLYKAFFNSLLNWLLKRTGFPAGNNELRVIRTEQFYRNLWWTVLAPSASANVCVYNILE